MDITVEERVSLKPKKTGMLCSFVFFVAPLLTLIVTAPDVNALEGSATADVPLATDLTPQTSNSNEREKVQTIVDPISKASKSSQDTDLTASDVNAIDNNARRKLKILEYKKRRVTFQNAMVTTVSGIDGNVSSSTEYDTVPHIGIDPARKLGDIEFYNYIGRSDLASRQYSRTRWKRGLIWGGIGAFLAGLGGALVGVVLLDDNISSSVNGPGPFVSSSSSSSLDSSQTTVLAIGSTVSLIGVGALIAGVSLRNSILSPSKQQSLGGEYNDRLRKEIGITDMDLVSSRANIGLMDRLLSTLSINPVLFPSEGGLAISARF